MSMLKAALLMAANNPADPYQMGYDCGLNGANEKNCAFGLFRTPERTREWERGKADGENDRRTTAPAPAADL